MRQIPKELEEAARLDGCGPFAIFFKVFLPLSLVYVVLVAGVHVRAPHTLH